MAILDTLSGSAQLELIYIGYFDRAADPGGYLFWQQEYAKGIAAGKSASDTLKDIANSFTPQTETLALYPFLSNTSTLSPTDPVAQAAVSGLVDSIYQNLFGRAADADGKAYWVDAILNGQVQLGQAILFIANGATGDDLAVLQNKVTVASDFTAEASAHNLGFGATLTTEFANAAHGVLDNVTKDAASVTAAEAYTDAFIANGGGETTGQTFTLTIGIDDKTGTSGNDTFDATESATAAATFTNMDKLDGGAGNDTLKIVQTAAVNTTTVTGTTVANIENIQITSGATVTADTTSWAGATSLKIAAGSNINATAAATTDITASASSLSGAAGAITVNGGKAVTVTAADTSTTGAASGNTILVGGTTAATDAVKVTYTETISDAANAGVAGSSITVTGGKTVEVNSLAVAGAGSAAADVLTLGAVAVNGNASTTEVTVKQSAATPVWDGTTQKNISIVDGAVTITDGNAATASDTIKTVTVENFGALRIDSTVLDTLNLKGGSTAATASGAIDLRQTLADTSTVAKTLTVNSSGGFMGALGVAATSTQANAYTAVNIASSADTTFADAGLAADAALTVSGAGVTTFTAFTAANNAALKTIVSSGGGLTIGTELATGVAVTGGAGVENIMIGATTKAIALGAGNDVLTISTTTLGAGGSASGGDGTDTLVANTNGSNIAGLPQFGGFEVLRVDGAAAQGAHNANGFTAIEVGALGAGNASFTNVAAGVGLTELKTMGNDLTVTLADATGTNDTFNLTLKSAGAIGAAGDTITLAGIENVTITTVDTDTTSHVDTVALIAAAAKSVTVTGNAGLAFTTNGANAAITSFDASGVVLAKETDTGVTFVSQNGTIGENVTIKGSNGIDVLTGSATANDTINGGAGADTLHYTGGADVFTGDAGKDIFSVDAVGTKAAYLTISDAASGDMINVATVGTGTTAAGALGAKATLGAGATFDQYLDSAAAGDGSANAVATWFQYGGDTYLVVDNSAGGTFVSGTDAVVKLVGTHDLSTSVIAAEVLTLA